MSTSIPASVECLVFDLDGTLYPKELQDSVKKHQRGAIVEKLFFSHFKNKEEGMIVLNQKCIDNNLEQITDVGQKDICKILDISPDDVWDVWDNLDFSHILSPNQKVIDVFQNLSKKYDIFLATNFTFQGSQKKLKALGLESFFKDKNIFTQDKIGAKGVVFWNKVQTNIPFSAQKIMVLGDSLKKDIQPAQEAGLLTFHVQKIEDLYSLK